MTSVLPIYRRGTPGGYLGRRRYLPEAIGNGVGFFNDYLRTVLPSIIGKGVRIQPVSEYTVNLSG